MKIFVDKWQMSQLQTEIQGLSICNTVYAEGNVDEMNASYQNETKVKV